jgi:hypothetical protein
MGQTLPCGIVHTLRGNQVRQGIVKQAFTPSLILLPEKIRSLGGKVRTEVKTVRPILLTAY